MVAAAIGGAALVGTIGTAITSSNAAGAQTSAANRAAEAQLQAQREAIAFQQRMFDTTQGNLRPYMDLGESGLNRLTGQIDGLNGRWDTPDGPDIRLPVIQATMPDVKPFGMTQADLEATPGYQFARSQGLKAVQNAASGRGLGVSGAALKGAANFATGLADQTYGNQFDRHWTQQNNLINAANSQFNQNQQLFGDWWTNYSNRFNVDQSQRDKIFNRLTGLINSGQNAAAGVGTAGTQTGANVGNQLVTTAGNVGNNIVGAGNAQAAASNAIGSSIAGAANGAGNFYLTNKLLDRFAGADSGWGLYGNSSNFNTLNS